MALQRNAPLARTLTTKASIHLQDGQLAKAEPLLAQALKANRRYAPAHNNMGLVHFEHNDLFRAALSFQEAMRWNPQSPEPQNNLGLVFEAAARPQMALEHYQAAHELSPTDPEFLGNLIRARLRTGEPPESLQEEFRQLLFIETRPDWIDWIEDQLELVTNPNLDRGPPAPDLNNLNSQGNGSQAFNEADRIIYDSGPASNMLNTPPSLSQPLPMGQPYEPVPARPDLHLPPATNTQPIAPPANILQPTPSAGTQQAPSGTGPSGSVPLTTPGNIPQAEEWTTPR